MNDDSLLNMPPIRELAKGQLITAIGTRGLSNLTYGKQYAALYGLERGIFAGSPFVTVLDDNGKQYACHYSRFAEGYNL